MVENAAKMGTFVATKRKVRNPILNVLILFTCFLLAHVIAKKKTFQKTGKKLLFSSALYRCSRSLLKTGSYYQPNILIKKKNCKAQVKGQFIYIIYIHPFSKRFSYRDIDRQIYSFVLLHVHPCAFFTSYCPTCEKTRFNDKFSVRQVLCSNLSIIYRFSQG